MNETNVESAAPVSRIASLDDAPGDLSIAAVRATPVNIALEAPYRWSVGLYPGLTRTIVEVETKSGLIGIGEAGSPWAALLIEGAIAPKLVGADPRNLADCERRALPPVGVMRAVDDDSLVRAYGGVEMALWDLNGKAQGRSLAEMLGGRVRERIRHTEYFAPRHGREQTPREIASYCSRMVEQYGARAFEGKVGFNEIGYEVSIAREVRAAIGDDAMLRLDANMGWSVSAAREALHRLEPLGIRSVEDPVRSVFEMARLRSCTSISFSTHEHALEHASAFGVPDAIVVNLTALGGIARTVAFVNACEHLGVDVWFYSGDTGVASAAYLQVAAGVDWLDEPSQTLLRWYVDDVIEGGPMQPQDGVLNVPTGPGLGVTLDPAAFQRAHESFRTHGSFDQYVHPDRPHHYGPRRIAANLGGR